MEKSPVLIEKSKQVGTIWLNRPEVRNAFDNHTIQGIIDGIKTLDADDQIRVIVIRGKGKIFCAGADLNWMKGSASQGLDGYHAESVVLANCFEAIYKCTKPTVSVVQGACMGGANGIISACDFVLAAVGTKFAFSEVKLGIIPATIAPYVIKRIGEYPARELMLTGKLFDTYGAHRFGLVNESFVLSKMELRLQELIDQLLLAGPIAQKSCKELIDNVVNKWTAEETKEKTIEAIVAAKMSDEGQEGMAAFLGKRKPNWQINE